MKEIEIKITHFPKEDIIRMNVEGTRDYTKILGLLEHAKMQMTCTYNKDVFEPSDRSEDDDLFSQE